MVSVLVREHEYCSERGEMRRQPHFLNPVFERRNITQRLTAMRMSAAAEKTLIDIVRG